MAVLASNTFGKVNNLSTAKGHIPQFQNQLMYNDEH
jgi:hypothetical protein